MIKYQAILKDYTNPFSVLRAKCKDVSFPLTPQIKDFSEDLLGYLDATEKQLNNPDYRSAVGIAAPQVGKALNIFAINFIDDNQIKHYNILFNPTMEIIDKTSVYLGSGEGCLSIPEDDTIPGYVPRNLIVKFKYQDINGHNQEITVSHFAAIVYQHEYDHLNGILFFDHINQKDNSKKITGGIKL